MALTKEYIQSLIPSDLPDGRTVLEEGIKMGETIEVEQSGFLRQQGFDKYTDFWFDEREKGKIDFSSNVGLATLEEQVEALTSLKSWCEKVGVNFFLPLNIPSINLAIPKEKRTDVADATSFMLESLDDYKAIANVEGICGMQPNNTLFVPNAFETTINSVKTGSPFIGCGSQIDWDFPGCDDVTQNLQNMLKCVGIMASKKKDGLHLTSYLEDGLAGNCVDTVSSLAIAMFEKYVYSDLCGSAYVVAFGGLITDIRYKSALLKAYDRLCRNEEHPGVMIFHASTTSQWEHDVECNFGSSLQEIMAMILAERHYKTGATIVTVPITEKVCVPTLENIRTIMGAAARMEEYAEQWEDMIDFTKIDHIADDMYDKAEIMFNNILTALSDANIDIEDPLKMMMFLKNFNGALFEESFHPSVKEFGKFRPYYPNDMGEMVDKMTKETLEELTRKGYVGTMTGKRILVGSMDCHIYGIRFVSNVLTAMGAEVVMGGVDNTCQSILDIADEQGINIIGISTHNGQSLGIAQQMKAVMAERNKKYTIFMGGVLNTILPGNSEPSDVTTMINDLGMLAANDLKVTIDNIRGK